MIRLATQKKQFVNSAITPAARANDTFDARAVREACEQFFRP